MSIERVNVIGVETATGLKTLELVLGDVTTIECDLLAVSAFAGGYSASKGTVLGSILERHGLSIREEADRPEIDLRAQFGIWISRRLKGLPFARVICVEIVGGVNDPEQAMENLYVGLAVLEAKGIPVRTIATPLLGAGDQEIDVELLVAPLIKKTTEALHRSRTLERVVVAARSEERAERVGEEIDRQFGARRSRLPGRELIPALLADIRLICETLWHRTEGVQKRLASEMLDVMSRDSPLATDIGLLARKLAEVVTDSLHASKPSIDLYAKIESLGPRGVSPWMVSYLHTLRVIGNEVVHIREKSPRIPADLADDDVVLCLFCMFRVTRFWLESIEQRDAREMESSGPSNQRHTKTAGSIE